MFCPRSSSPPLLLLLPFLSHTPHLFMHRRKPDPMNVLHVEAQTKEESLTRRNTWGEINMEERPRKKIEHPEAGPAPTGPTNDQRTQLNYCLDHCSLHNAYAIGLNTRLFSRCKTFYYYYSLASATLRVDISAIYNEGNFCVRSQSPGFPWAGTLSSRLAATDSIKICGTCYLIRVFIIGSNWERPHSFTIELSSAQALPLCFYVFSLTYVDAIGDASPLPSFSKATGLDFSMFPMRRYLMYDMAKLDAAWCTPPTLRSGSTHPKQRTTRCHQSWVTSSRILTLGMMEPSSLSYPGPVGRRDNITAFHAVLYTGKPP